MSTKPTSKQAETVDRPPHYLQHPSGREVIELTELLDFCTGNAVKYLLRAGLKGDAAEDLRKAQWYLRRRSRAAVLHMNPAELTRVHAEFWRAMPDGPRRAALIQALHDPAGAIDQIDIELRQLAGPDTLPE